MMISSKGRYALRVMLDLASGSSEGYVPSRDIAARQGLSPKYLESIMTLLSKAGLIEGVHGKGGGYKLSVLPEECTVGRILKLTEGSLSPVACVHEGVAQCEHAASCPTVGVFARLDRIIDEYLESVTVSDLLKENAAL
ncbi:MAG: Rrf2 family transcriptional regulator [Clostridia bacterium]|nr:Rrf2 family transcriptional regulator [Clostridia bacterium]